MEQAGAERRTDGFDLIGDGIRMPTGHARTTRQLTNLVCPHVHGRRKPLLINELQQNPAGSMRGYGGSRRCIAVSSWCDGGCRDQKLLPWLKGMRHDGTQVRPLKNANHAERGRETAFGLRCESAAIFRHVLDLSLLSRSAGHERVNRAFSRRPPASLRWRQGPAMGDLRRMRALESHADRRTVGSDRGV